MENVTNNIANGIKYCGFVTIKTFKDNILLQTTTHHNNGTEFLFKVLSSSLCGNNESNSMPKYLDIGVTTISTDDGTENYNSIINNKLYLSSKVITNFTTSNLNYEYGASFTATLSSFNIIEDGSLDTLKIYSMPSDETTLLAKVNLETPIAISYSSGYSYIIEWVMTFSN